MLRNNILTELRKNDPILENIYILRLEHDFKIAEIAKITSISNRSVSRAISKIFQIIEQKFGDDLESLV